MSALIGAGLGVRRFAEAEAGLESFFLQLTGAGAKVASPRTGGDT